jgi:hypothetical protein
MTVHIHFLGSRHGLNTVIGLQSAGRYDGICIAFDGFRHQVFKLPGLIPAGGEAGQVIPLDIQFTPMPQFGCQIRHAMQGRRQLR